MSRDHTASGLAFLPPRSSKTVDKAAMDISRAVGHGHVGEKWGPVLGVTALPASTPITPSVKEYQLTPLYCFLPRLLRNTTYIVFQWRHYYLWTDFYACLRDFCPEYDGSKNVKFSGVGVPL